MVLLPFLIVFIVTIVEVLASSCEGTSNCTCIRQPNTSYQMDCPKSLDMDSTFSAEFQPNISFQVQCKNSADIDFSLMDGLDIGPVKYFALKFCPLPKMPIKELMDSLRISQVTNIEFKSYYELKDSLLPNLFEDLASVKHISLNNNGFTSLPENIFDGMPNLETIALWDNKLKSIPRYIFSRTPQLQVLELGSNKLVNLEQGIFKNLSHLRLLNLWSNQLVNLTRSLLADIPNLENLDLTSNGLKTLSPDIFTDLVKLSALNLNHNEFTHLPYGLFFGTPSLERLRLNFNKKTLVTLPDRFLANLAMLSEVSIAQCNISVLPEDLFWNSSNIATVSFEGNQLKELPRDLFRDTKELLRVDLRNNKLESLPNHLFSQTHKLKEAKLSHNNLFKISSHTFRGLSQLKTLDLQYNRLNDIDGEAFVNLESLTEINLSNNNLTFQDKSYELFGSSANSPLQYCSKLEIVLLANNKIEQIFQDWRFILLSLRILDLSQNKIKNITKADLLFISKDVTLNLNNNEITRINLQNIETFALQEMSNSMGVNYKIDRKSTHILIGNNPIICDCFLYDLIRYYENALTPEVRYLFNIDVGDTSCAGPREVQHVKVSKLYSKSLFCSLDQIHNVSHPCPSHCICSFRVHDSAIIIDCSNGNYTQIPRKIPSVEGVRKTELNMSYNSLMELPLGNIFIENNFTKIDVSHNQIQDVGEVSFPESLQVLRLDNNNISVLPEKTLTIWAGMKHLTQLTLHGNHWQCDCKTQFLLNFIHEHYKQIPNHENITCWPDETKSFKSLTINDLCPVALDLIIFGSVTIAILGVLAGLSAALFFRYQREIKVWLFAHQLCLWFVTEEELDKDKKYDAFVSYSVLDKEFVEKKLVTELESGPRPFKLCLHYRDWEPGGWIHNQIIKSVDDSRRTLIVLSRNFLDSDWSRLEFQAAHKQALSEGRARVIIILYGDIGPKDNLHPDLKTYLSTNTYIEWGDPWFWKKLKYALPHPPELRKRIPGELKDRNIRRYEEAEKLDLMRKSNNSLSIESTPPADSVTTNPLKTLNCTKEYTSTQCDIIAQMA